MNIRDGVLRNQQQKTPSLMLRRPRPHGTIFNINGENGILSSLSKEEMRTLLGELHRGRTTGDRGEQQKTPSLMLQRRKT